MEPLSLLQTLAYRGREEEREGGSLPQREPPIKGEREERRGRERDLPFSIGLLSVHAEALSCVR